MELTIRGKIIFEKAVLVITNCILCMFQNDILELTDLKSGISFLCISLFANFIERRMRLKSSYQMEASDVLRVVP